MCETYCLPRSREGSFAPCRPDPFFFYVLNLISNLRDGGAKTLKALDGLLQVSWLFQRVTLSAVSKSVDLLIQEAGISFMLNCASSFTPSPFPPFHPLSFSFLSLSLSLSLSWIWATRGKRASSSCLRTESSDPCVHFWINELLHWHLLPFLHVTKKAFREIFSTACEAS